VRVLAAGVILARHHKREGVHPAPVPFTPGWDLVGIVDRLGDGVSGIEPGQIVAAADPRCYAEFVCVPQRELVPVPSAPRRSVLKAAPLHQHHNQWFDLALLGRPAWRDV
jgi:NADPH:quinone reductase-like Zn-dependent oxidoreductase